MKLNEATKEMLLNEICRKGNDNFMLVDIRESIVLRKHSVDVDAFRGEVVILKLFNKNHLIFGRKRGEIWNEPWETLGNVDILESEIEFWCDIR